MSGQKVTLVDLDGSYVPAGGGGGSSNITQWNGNTVSLNNGAADAGTLRVTLANNGTGIVSLAAGAALIGTVQPVPATSGGCSLYEAIVPANTTGVVVKNSAGMVYGIQLCNTSAVLGVLHLYDSASAPTAGAGTIVKTLLVPGPAAGGGGGNNVTFPVGIAFANGIAYTFTTGIAHADTGAPSAGTYSISIDYK